MRDFVTSFLPFSDDMRLWVFARPMTGFAETFSQYIMEVQPGGGSDRPELAAQAEGVLFVVVGIDAPDVIMTNENDIAPTVMPDTDGAWATTRFVDPAKLRHDMHFSIVTFQPGGVIPFLETHVMQHGLYVVARVLPAGVLCEWAGQVRLSALQECEPPHELADHTKRLEHTKKARAQ